VTNKTGIKDKLSNDDRRELTLRGLSGEPRQYLAETYGVSLSRVEKLLRAARAMTEADVNEARKEYEHRRQVWVMNRG
jgi:DNA-directed RNA polymerase specialized sigma24 family protein